MKKNVLFIAIDDLRPEINCYGSRKLDTPAMDGLADRGTLFENAYCQSPQCMPSRASLMSGIRPDEEVEDRIKDICTGGEPTLPGHFKNNGYKTVSMGKVYHWNDEDEGAWTRKHRDTFYEEDYAVDGYCSGYQLEENKEKIKNFSKVLFEDGPTDKSLLPDIYESADVPDEEYPDGLIAEKGLGELKRLSEEEEPFFLALGFYRPHLPWAVPQKYWDLYDPSEVDLADNQFFPENGICKSNLVDFMHYGDELINDTYSDFGRYNDEDFPRLDEEKQRECIRAYWASVSFTDAQIGKVLEGLRELGIEEETTIVLWGDNGWHLGEHKLWAKCTSFEESTHVPLLISDPEFDPTEGTDSITELVDIYPTLCELCGLKTPDHLQGSSLVPLLGNPSSSVKEAAYSRWGDFYSMRTRDYRLTYFQNASEEGDEWHLPNENNYELFDLENDPRENVNVIEEDEYQDVLVRLKDKLWDFYSIPDLEK